jgi:C1A family cysteine protease
MADNAVTNKFNQVGKLSLDDAKRLIEEKKHLNLTIDGSKTADLVNQQTPKKPRVQGFFDFWKKKEDFMKPEDSKIVNPGTIPISLDWRDRGVITRVKRQGACGSCWALTAAGMLESMYAISKN